MMKASDDSEAFLMKRLRRFSSHELHELTRIIKQDS
jgi:hypothetical protein